MTRRETSAPGPDPRRRAGNPVHVQFGGDPGRGKPSGVVDVLVAEDVQIADVEIRRRQLARSAARAGAA